MVSMQGIGMFYIAFDDLFGAEALLVTSFKELAGHGVAACFYVQAILCISDSGDAQLEPSGRALRFISRALVDFERLMMSAI